jgi:hypothetical protein
MSIKPISTIIQMKEMGHEAAVALGWVPVGRLISSDRRID